MDGQDRKTDFRILLIADDLGFALLAVVSIASGGQSTGGKWRCPIVCSNVTSLPELAGGAAMLVNPYDVEGLADAMWRVLNDHDLRADLVARGLTRTRHFSWERAARQTVQVYRYACQS